MAPPDELNTLITRRSRRRARRARRLPHRIAILRRRELLDWVQAVDARLTVTGGAILGESSGPGLDDGAGRTFRPTRQPTREE
jgi:hypothetical protein